MKSIKISLVGLVVFLFTLTSQGNPIMPKIFWEFDLQGLILQWKCNPCG